MQHEANARDAAKEHFQHESNIWSTPQWSLKLVKKAYALSPNHKTLTFAWPTDLVCASLLVTTVQVIPRLLELGGIDLQVKISIVLGGRGRGEGEGGFDNKILWSIGEKLPGPRNNNGVVDLLAGTSMLIACLCCSNKK